MGDARNRAEWYAADIVNLLWRKTGHRYRNETDRNERSKWLDIYDDTTGTLVLTYHAKTWSGVCEKITASYKTYLAIANA